MPSSVQWIQGSPQTFITTPARLLDTFRPRLYKRMQKVMSEAVEDYRRFTSSRGTASSGKAGRIDTGAMLNAVTYRVNQVAGEIVGEFGFINEQELYYFLQTDTGFRHWISNEFIEPTFALRDAAAIAFAKLIESRV